MLIFLLVVLVPSTLYSEQFIEYSNVGMVEHGGETLGWMGVFRNDFMVDDNGIVLVGTVFYSFQERQKLILEITVIQGEERIVYAWPYKIFKDRVVATDPKEYAFPDGMDKENSITFIWIFPVDLMNFYKPFTVKYKTAYDSTWHTYDILTPQPIEREYWRRDKALD